MKRGGIMYKLFFISQFREILETDKQFMENLINWTNALFFSSI